MPPPPAPAPVPGPGSFAGSDDRDRDRDRTPVPSLKELLPSLDSDDRIRILEYIDHGGVGEILRGRDDVLARDVAVKVLKAEFVNDPVLTQCFIEEAQIAGQLLHPGVAPIHELGRMPDGRPFFTMKLVHGRTLDILLEGRSNPASDLPRFLKVFQEIARTMAYVHSRGVIHRNLKPSHVMVGQYGEVQIMEWGLAEIIDPSRGVSLTRPNPELVRPRHWGEAVGTPQYMPPEQARGDLAAMGYRSDVFSLGAILCEILTGAPPFSEPDALLQTRRGDLTDAFARLNACVEEPELADLARYCLEPKPENRPANASAIAQEMEHYLNSIQHRLREVEEERIRNLARMAETRKRGEMISILTLLGVFAVLLGLQGWNWVARQRARDESRIQELLRLAEATYRQAVDHPDLPGAWRRVERDVQLVRDVYGVVGGDPTILRRADDLLTRAGVASRARAASSGFANGARADASEPSSIVGFEASPSSRPSSPTDRLDFLRGCAAAFGESAADAIFSRGFGELGFDPDAAFEGTTSRIENETWPARLNAFTPDEREILLLALEEWWFARRALNLPAARRDAPLAFANRLDPNSERAKIRASILSGDPKAIDELELPLSRRPAPGGSPLPAFDEGAIDSDRRGDRGTALVRAARMAEVFGDDPSDARAALGLYRAAAIARPGLAPLAAEAHRRAGRTLEALAIWNGLDRSEPEATLERARLLVELGRGDEAWSDLERLSRATFPEFDARLGLDGADAGSSVFDGRDARAGVEAPIEANEGPGAVWRARLRCEALRLMGWPRHAEWTARVALADHPDHPLLLAALGLALDDAGARGEAMAVLTRARDRAPGDREVAIALARVLRVGGRERDALEILDEIVRRAPFDPDALFERAATRAALGRRGGARDDLRALLDRHPERGDARRLLDSLPADRP